MLPKIGGIDAVVLKSDRHLLRTYHQLANMNKPKASSPVAQLTPRYYSHRSPWFSVGSMGAGSMYGNPGAYRRMEIYLTDPPPGPRMLCPNRSFPLEGRRSRVAPWPAHQRLTRRPREDKDRRHSRPRCGAPSCIFEAVRAMEGE